jgi:hypothetical protein
MGGNNSEHPDLGSAGSTREVMALKADVMYTTALPPRHLVDAIRVVGYLGYTANMCGASIGADC